MSNIKNIFNQLRYSKSSILFILGTSILILSPVLALNLWKGVPISILTSDPAVIGDIAPYVGFLSQLGIFFWAAAAAICFFTAHSISLRKNTRTIWIFLIVSGFLSLLLGFDDIFLIHERIFPYIGIPQEIVIFSYAVLVLVWLIKFFSIIINSEFSILLISLFFFGFSIFIDLVKLDIPGRLFMEDGAKLVGIVSWFTYFFRVGIASINIHHQETYSR